MIYPKINSLYKREGVTIAPDGTVTFSKAKKHPLILGEYSSPEYGLINRWQAFEKIDGTNIRIIFTQNVIHSLVESPNPPKPRCENAKIEIKGRTDNSSIPSPLLQYLQHTFTVEKIQSAFPEAHRVVLFGEGYGPKIQSGGFYSDYVSFILFDIVCEGWWLKYEDRLEICQKLKIDHVPLIGEMSEAEIVAYVSMQPKSKIAQDKEFVMEGLVCVTNPLLRDRKGDIVKFKLRCEDFRD